MTRFLPAVALLWCAATAATATTAAAQERVRIVDIGPGPSGRILRDALRRPHRLAEPDSGWLIITREVQVRGALIVLGRTTRIDGSVDGDVIVVGGDLFVRPGARVGGRAIVIGGGAYPSALATVTGGAVAYRDNTFDIKRVDDGYELSYQSTEEPPEPPLLFPQVYGFRMPAYDRINGLSVPFGPAFTLGSRGGRVDLLGTWRSDMGVVDPSLRATYHLSRRNRVSLDAGRGTFTNERWIWEDWVNSFFTLAFGDDTRNFYRADRGEAAVHRLVELAQATWEPFVGGAIERAWSAGSPTVATSAPWSLFGRTDTTLMRRGNPSITPGTIASAVVGTQLHWNIDDVVLRARTRAEVSLLTPNDSAFQQLTTDVAVFFPTFGEQEYAADVHWVASRGSVPLQRFVYLGGAGTLPFLDMLSIGGDQLLLIDQRYSIPLTRVRLGDFGNPSLQLRHRIASAGLGNLPTFETMLGVGVAIVFVRGEVQIDPATGKARLAGGFTFAR